MSQTATDQQLKIYYRQNIDKWILHAQSKGIKPGYHSPPIDRLLRRWGYQFPPILFWPFFQVVLVMGTYFGTAWGLLMYFILWRPANLPLSIAYISSIGAGVSFGLFMAIYYYFFKKKHGLSTWDKFTKEYGVS